MQVAVYERLPPRLEQPPPECRPVDFAGVEPSAVRTAGEVVEEADLLEFAGDLQIEWCIRHVGGLHDPFQAMLVLGRAVAFYIVKGSLLA